MEKLLSSKAGSAKFRCLEKFPVGNSYGERYVTKFSFRLENNTTETYKMSRIMDRFLNEIQSRTKFKKRYMHIHTYV